MGFPARIMGRSKNKKYFDIQNEHLAKVSTQNSTFTDYSPPLILVIFYLFFGGAYQALTPIWLIWDPIYYMFLESSWYKLQENLISKVFA